MLLLLSLLLLWHAYVAVADVFTVLDVNVVVDAAVIVINDVTVILVDGILVDIVTE